MKPALLLATVVLSAILSQPASVRADSCLKTAFHRLPAVVHDVTLRAAAESLIRSSEFKLFEDLRSVGARLRIVAPIPPSLIERGLASHRSEIVRGSAYAIRFVMSDDAPGLLKKAIKMSDEVDDTMFDILVIGAFSYWFAQDESIASKTIAETRLFMSCLTFAFSNSCAQKQDELRKLFRKKNWHFGKYCDAICIRYVNRPLGEHFQSLEEYCTSDDILLRRRGFESLGSLGAQTGQRGTRLFKRALWDEDKSIRTTAIENARNFDNRGDNPLLPELLRIAKDNRDECQDLARLILSQEIEGLSQTDALELATSGLNGSHVMKKASLQTMQRLTRVSDEILEHVRGMLRDEALGVRFAAVDVIVRKQQWLDNSKKELLGMVGKGDRELDLRIIQRIAPLLLPDNEVAKPVLAKCLTSDSSELRVAAAVWLLIHKKSTPESDRILAQATDDDRTAHEAFRGLLSYAPDAEKVKWLRKAFGTKSTYVQTLAKEVLTTLKEHNGEIDKLVSDKIRDSKEDRMFFVEFLSRQGRICLYARDHYVEEAIRSPNDHNKAAAMSILVGTPCARRGTLDLLRVLQIEPDINLQAILMSQFCRER